MKKFLFLIVFLISSPSFAACPIDGVTDACIAEFQAVPIAKPMKSIINQNDTVKEFSSTPTTTVINREEQAVKPLRTFGPTSKDYGYNSSCQFGICRDTGTPKSFEGQNN